MITLTTDTDCGLASMEAGVRCNECKLQESLNHLLHLGVALEIPAGPLEAIVGLQE